MRCPVTCTRHEAGRLRDSLSRRPKGMGGRRLFFVAKIHGSGDNMRLAQIIIFLVGVLAAVGLLIMESMAP